MKCFYLLVALVVALLFSACTQTASSDDDSSSKTLTEIYFPKLDRITDGYEAELYFNYVMIDLYYLYGHSRNEIADDYKVYLGKGTDADERGKGYCTAPYYDVCYMYNQLMVYNSSTEAWDYTPIKYWPNEHGSSATSAHIDKLSFWERYVGFTYGLFDLSNALFFISAEVSFLLERLQPI